MNYIDISIEPDKKIINNKFDFILQEIGILFDTSPGEVLGEPLFGTDFEKFIWDTNVSNTQISEYILNKINSSTISGSEFNISVNTDILYGTNNDIIIVKIEIKEPQTGESTTVSYKIG